MAVGGTPLMLFSQCLPGRPPPEWRPPDCPSQTHRRRREPHRALELQPVQMVGTGKQAGTEVQVDQGELTNVNTTNRHHSRHAAMLGGRRGLGNRSCGVGGVGRLPDGGAKVGTIHRYVGLLDAHFQSLLEPGRAADQPLRRHLQPHGTLDSDASEIQPDAGVHGTEPIGGVQPGVGQHQSPVEPSMIELQLAPEAGMSEVPGSMDVGRLEVDRAIKDRAHATERSGDPDRIELEALGGTHRCKAQGSVEPCFGKQRFAGEGRGGKGRGLVEAGLAEVSRSVEVPTVKQRSATEAGAVEGDRPVEPDTAEAGVARERGCIKAGAAHKVPTGEVHLTRGAPLLALEDPHHAVVGWHKIGAQGTEDPAKQRGADRGPAHIQGCALADRL
jgi:hypothetical protein